MDNIQKRVRMLEAYAVISFLGFGVMALSAFTQANQKFSEISVEQLNVVEKNGKLRVVIANSERMPDPIISGKAFKSERPPGMIFYNSFGDECGDLIFDAVAGAANMARTVASLSISTSNHKRSD